MSHVINKVRATLALAISAALLMSLAGCSGSSSSNGPNVRVFDGVSNGGTTTIYLGSTAFVTNQPVFSPTFYTTTNQTSPLISFTLSQYPGTTYPTTQATMASGDYYTVNLFGRADVAVGDPRYPAAVYSLDDRTSPNIGNTRIRVVNAAPDLGAVDVTVTDTSDNPSVIDVGLNVPYKTTTAMTETQAGTFPVNVYLTGTTNAVLPTVTYDFLNGNYYTLYITEQTVNPPTYATVVLDDYSVAPTNPTNP